MTLSLLFFNLGGTAADNVSLATTEVADSAAFTVSEPHDYYFAAAGNDSTGSGTQASPWQTISKANGLTLNPGDTLNFNGGDSFSGLLYITTTNYATGLAGAPLIIQSYGTGQANFSNSSGSAMYIYNVGAVEINNISVTSTGSSYSGLFFYVDAASTILPAISIINCTLASIGQNGIVIGSNSSASGYNGITISGCSVTGCGNNGIQVYGTSTNANHTNVLVTKCTVYNNLGTGGLSNASGSGIVISNINGGVISYCVAYGNGANNTNSAGPVGIWTYESNNVIIQYCESYNNTSNYSGGGGDGGGFDLDGGCTNCIIEYCYSHGNNGPGFMAWQYSGASTHNNNIIRYCISQNDGGNFVGSIQVGGASSATLTNLYVYNNTCYQSVASCPCVGISTLASIGVNFYNNIFYLTNAYRFVDTFTMNPTNAVFNGNDYYGASGIWNWNNTNYTTFASWQSATSQELLASVNVGLTSNPALLNPGGGGTLNGYYPGQLSAYYIPSTSPMCGTGLNLSTHFSISDGGVDFFGDTTPNPTGTGYNVGADGASRQSLSLIATAAVFMRSASGGRAYLPSSAASKINLQAAASPNAKMYSKVSITATAYLASGGRASIAAAVKSMITARASGTFKASMLSRALVTSTVGDALTSSASMTSLFGQIALMSMFRSSPTMAAMVFARVQASSTIKSSGTYNAKLSTTSRQDTAVRGLPLFNQPMLAKSLIAIIAKTGNASQASLQGRGTIQAKAAIGPTAGQYLLSRALATTLLRANAAPKAQMSGSMRSSIEAKVAPTAGQYLSANARLAVLAKSTTLPKASMAALSTLAATLRVASSGTVRISGTTAVQVSTRMLAGGRAYVLSRSLASIAAKANVYPEALLSAKLLASNQVRSNSTAAQKLLANVLAAAATRGTAKPSITLSGTMLSMASAKITNNSRALLSTTSSIQAATRATSSGKVSLIGQASAMSFIRDGITTGLVMFGRTGIKSSVGATVHSQASMSASARALVSNAANGTYKAVMAARATTGTAAKPAPIVGQLLFGRLSSAYSVKANPNLKAQLAGASSTKSFAHLPIALQYRMSATTSVMSMSANRMLASVSMFAATRVKGSIASSVNGSTRLSALTSVSTRSASAPKFNLQMFGTTRAMASTSIVNKLYFGLYGSMRVATRSSAGLSGSINLASKSLTAVSIKSFARLSAYLSASTVASVRLTDAMSGKATMQAATSAKMSAIAKSTLTASMLAKTLASASSRGLVSGNRQLEFGQILIKTLMRASVSPNASLSAVSVSQIRAVVTPTVYPRIRPTRVDLIPNADDEIHISLLPDAPPQPEPEPPAPPVMPIEDDTPQIVLSLMPDD